MNINCPNCGKSYYAEHYSTTTALGWTPVYKDGVEINGNPNVTTTYCTCCNCKHNFHYEEQYGEIIKIIDDGEKPEVPVLEVPLTIPNDSDDFKIDPEKLIAPSSKFENSIHLVTDEDLAELKEQVKELCDEIKEIKKEIWALNNPGSYYDY